MSFFSRKCVCCLVLPGRGYAVSPVTDSVTVGRSLHFRFAASFTKWEDVSFTSAGG